MAAAAGRDVGLPAAARRGRAAGARPARVAAPGRRARRPGRRRRRRGSFRFRHALLAEAVYATLLPGEREELHARLAERARAQRGRGTGGARAALGGRGPQRRGAGRLGRGGAPGGGRLRPRRGPRAPRAGARAVARRAGRGRGRRARPRRALRLGRRAGRPDGRGAARGRARASARSSSSATATPCAPRSCTSGLGRYLHASGRGDAALAAFERAVELVPAQPPSPERAQVLAALGNGLMLAWRYDESLAICEQALALARAVGAQPGRAPRAHGARQRPRVPRPRRRGPRAAPAGAGSSPRSAAIPRPAAGVRRAHRRADDAGPAARVGATGGGRRSRRCTATGAINHARRQPGRGPGRDRRVGRGRPRQRGGVRAITANYPHHPSSSAPASRPAAATSTPPARTSRPRRRPCTRTPRWPSTTRTSPSSRCGSAAGRTPTRP